MKKSLLWTILRVFPFAILALFMIMRLGQGTVQYESQINFYEDIENFTDNFVFNPVYNIVKSALRTENRLQMNYWDTTHIIASLVSYEILITLVHIAYSVFEFFPRFCISIFERKMKK